MSTGTCPPPPAPNLLHCRSPNGAADACDYRGSRDYTKGDHRCSFWNETADLFHDYTAENFPDAGLGDHNYCRNPGGRKPTAWCYTTNPDVEWEKCELDVCSASRPCQGDRRIFNLGYGRCSTYGLFEENHAYCSDDAEDGVSADDVCHECGICHDPSPQGPPAPAPPLPPLPNPCDNVCNALACSVFKAWDCATSPEQLELIGCSACAGCCASSPSPTISSIASIGASSESDSAGRPSPPPIKPFPAPPSPPPNKASSVNVAGVVVGIVLASVICAGAIAMTSWHRRRATKRQAELQVSAGRGRVGAARTNS